MARSYNELVKRMPVVKTLTEQGDTDALENLYRNVHLHFSHVCVYTYSNGCCSCAKVLIWPVATMLEVSNPQLSRGSTSHLDPLFQP